ncbi:MAG: hypothetical protein ACLGHC_00345 [Alphaproteobacteria bacterium]
MPALACGPFLLALLSLAACSGDSGAPTEEQKAELDRAEQMLNEAPADLSGIDENALGDASPAEDPQPSGEEPR